jgi:hypothetical protein
VHGDDGLADFLDRPLIGHFGGVLDHQHLAVGAHHLVDHAGRGGDQVLVELALEALLHDLHVQQAQKAAAKAKAQRLADLGLVAQGRVVELELFQRIAQPSYSLASVGYRPANTCGLISLKPGKASVAEGRGAGRF